MKYLSLIIIRYFSDDPSTSGGASSADLLLATANAAANCTQTTVFRKVDTIQFDSIFLGRVGFLTGTRTEIRTETVETITGEVGLERESNPRPPAWESLKHGM